MFSRRASRVKLAWAVWRDETPIDWLPDPKPGRNLDAPNAWLLKRTGRSERPAVKPQSRPLAAPNARIPTLIQTFVNSCHYATILPSLLTVTMATFRQVGAGKEYDILRLNDGGWE
jgi:hypothetical protein